MNYLNVLVITISVVISTFVVKMIPNQHTEWIAAEAHPAKLKCLTWDEARVELNIDGERLLSFMINQVCDEDD
ncbi:MAG: hypothetical protein D6732_03340 [Methanobacteriota archaeon]|nr:MAG: hypothetical protein D6732_03340 [Euryarchaeota archaeon]